MSETTEDRACLQCNESEAAIRASQRKRDPIYCGAVDAFGECEWEAERHRFADWTDRELIEGWRIKPEHVDRYRRIMSGYEIDPAHHIPKSHDSESRQETKTARDQSGHSRTCSPDTRASVDTLTPEDAVGSVVPVGEVVTRQRLGLADVECVADDRVRGEQGCGDGEKSAHDDHGREPRADGSRECGGSPRLSLSGLRFDGEPHDSRSLHGVDVEARSFAPVLPESGEHGAADDRPQDPQGHDHAQDAQDDAQDDREGGHVIHGLNVSVGPDRDSHHSEGQTGEGR